MRLINEQTFTLRVKKEIFGPKLVFCKAPVAKKQEFLSWRDLAFHSNVWKGSELRNRSSVTENKSKSSETRHLGSKIIFFGTFLAEKMEK